MRCADGVCVWEARQEVGRQIGRGGREGGSKYFCYTRLLAEVLELINAPFCLSSIVATSQLLLHVFLTYNNLTYPHTLYDFLFPHHTHPSITS